MNLHILPAHIQNNFLKNYIDFIIENKVVLEIKRGNYFSRKNIEQIKKYLAGDVFKKLEQVDGIIPFPCSANFILCQWTGTEDMDDLVHYLLENSAYVRDCRNFPGLENNFFRICLRSPDDNDKLMSILSSFPYA